jgi:hypothetical protein
MEDRKEFKRTFAHWHWLIDYDSYEWCCIVVELIDGVPVSSYVIPPTKPYLRFTIYPYVLN